MVTEALQSSGDLLLNIDGVQYIVSILRNNPNEYTLKLKTSGFYLAKCLHPKLIIFLTY